MDTPDHIDPQDEARWQTPCARPGCGHTLRDHDMLTTGGCLRQGCACPTFRSLDSLIARLTARLEWF